MKDIKPCPFCGIVPKKLNDKSTEVFHDPSYNGKGYECPVIGYLTISLLKWNKRHEF